MNWEMLTPIDYAVIMILLIPSAIGVVKGFFRPVFGLVGSLSGLGLGMVFARPLGDILKNVFTSSDYFTARVVAYILIFSGCWLSGIILGLLLKKIAKAIQMGWLDRVLGALLGLLEGSTVVIIILVIMTLTPDFQSVLSRSTVALPMVTGASFVVRQLPGSWQNYLDPQRWIGICKTRLLPKSESKSEAKKETSTTKSSDKNQSDRIKPQASPGRTQ
jgi:membrane protein required for colicin V production